MGGVPGCCPQAPPRAGGSPRAGACRTKDAAAAAAATCSSAATPTCLGGGAICSPISPLFYFPTPPKNKKNPPPGRAPPISKGALNPFFPVTLFVSKFGGVGGGGGKLKKLRGRGAKLRKAVLRGKMANKGVGRNKGVGLGGVGGQHPCLGGSFGGGRREGWGGSGAASGVEIQSWGDSRQARSFIRCRLCPHRSRRCPHGAGGTVTP